MLKTIKSKIKCSHTAIANRLIEEGAVPVDLKDIKNKDNYKWWKNSEDTIVLKIKNKVFNIQDLLNISRNILFVRPNEFDYIPFDNDSYVLRMWWD